MSHSPKKPKEPKDAKELRQRQLIDLAKLDEEENRRIKAMFRGRHGGRAFRSPLAARSAGDMAGAGGFAASGLVAPSGFAGGGGANATLSGRGGSWLRTGRNAAQV